MKRNARTYIYPQIPKGVTGGYISLLIRIILKSVDTQGQTPQVEGKHPDRSVKRFDTFREVVKVRGGWFF